jgi:hypothetical protein
VHVDQWPAEVFPGEITDVAAVNMDVMPRDLAGARDLAARVDASGIARPLEPSYQARVALDEHRLPLLLRGGGRARIDAAPTPLALRAFRALRQVFHFKL